jgi:hypothetical protein
MNDCLPDLHYEWLMNIFHMKSSSHPSVSIANAVRKTWAVFLDCLNALVAYFNFLFQLKVLLLRILKLLLKVSYTRFCNFQLRLQSARREKMLQEIEHGVTPINQAESNGQSRPSRRSGEATL